MFGHNKLRQCVHNIILFGINYFDIETLILSI